MGQKEGERGGWKKVKKRQDVYHLHGETGWFTVWANGNQKF